MFIYSIILKTAENKTGATQGRGRGVGVEEGVREGRNSLPNRTSLANAG